MMSKKPKLRHTSRKLPNQVEIIDLPPLDPNRTYRIYSPRLKHPMQAKDFYKVMVEESVHGSFRNLPD
ncbi:MAG: hypothetical protein AAB354_13790 [candidate division KSB1 bacterium]